LRKRRNTLTRKWRKAESSSKNLRMNGNREMKK